MELLTQLAKKFSKKYDIRLIYIFGSFLSERMAPQSDLDIAILFGDGHDSYSLFRFAELFKLELLPKIQRKIDISILNIADPILNHEVITTGRVIFSKDKEELYVFERRVSHDYEDYCYFQKYYDDQLQKKLLEN